MITAGKGIEIKETRPYSKISLRAFPNQSH